MRIKHALILAALLQMAAHSAFAAQPTDIGLTDLYSDIDTRIRLAIKSDASPCQEQQCEENRLFDAHVEALGAYLVAAAREAFPEKQKIINKLNFSVIEKQEIGIASSAKGQIMVLRGLQTLQLSDDALAFVLAREVGHLLGEHHSTNVSTKLIISALASVIFPAAAVVAASSTAAQASTATTLITSAASTATSMIGGEVAVSKMKPAQLEEADDFARKLMDTTSWDIRSVNSELMQDEAPQSGWMLDLEQSRARLEAEILAEDAKIELLPEDFFYEYQE